MSLLAFDTATSATVVGLRLDGGGQVELAHVPGPDERPGHTPQLLTLIDRVLGQAGITLGQIERIAVGVGPGSFTGLRVGLATARALARTLDSELVGVSSLAALALPAVQSLPGRPVLAAIDARRGELFVALYHDEGCVVDPIVVSPERAVELVSESEGAILAVGDGALRFVETLRAAGAEIPDGDSPLHGITGLALCGLGLGATSQSVEEVLPQYLRKPDAELR